MYMQFVKNVSIKNLYFAVIKISLSHRYQIAIWFRSFNGNLYICRTCSRELQKGKALCQAVSNKLKVFDLPIEFQSMQKLEKVLIAKCLLFKKVTIMPSGLMLKIFGTICNVPVDTVEVTNL